MKIFLLSIILLSPSFLLSQDYNQYDREYLESLPDDIRQDLLLKIDAKEELEKPVYRRGSSEIDKPDDEINSMMESLRFGAKIFDTMQTSFMPINEPNFDNSYILDFGDVLEVQLIGQKNTLETILVKRDGTINIPDIGKVYVSGLPLEDAVELISKKVETTLIGTSAYISLTNIRDIQVLISGNAYNPGIYTLNGNSNALHALSMAGGIDELGSYRSIKIIRKDEVIDELDLYDIFVYGKSNFGPRLRSGDSIFVTPHKSLVNVSTGVKRPATYELKTNETFFDVINFANGISTNADLNFIAIERIVEDSIQLDRIENLDQLKDLKASDGDALFIKEFNLSAVTLKGAVNVPGRYLIKEGETLSSIIERAGGYRDTAYPFGGNLQNKRALEISLAAKENLYDQFLEEILFAISMNPGGGGSSLDPNLIPILEDLRDSSESGRVMAEFDLDVISDDENLDTTLEDGDEILIPYITQQVYIYGEVNNSGTVRYSANKNLEYYIRNAGGLKNSSDKKSIFIVHPNGSTKLLTPNNGTFSFLNSQKSSLDIYPGSVIYVPRKSNTRNPVLIASVWAPIVSSLALSITSLSVLDNN